jgi:iron(III) transport system substrate-binding protein
MICKRIVAVLSAAFICTGIFVGCGNNVVDTASSKAKNAKEVEVKETNNKKEDKEVKETYSGKEGQITVYLSGPETMVNKLEEIFEKDRGDVLNIYHTGCGPLRQKVWTEMEAGQIQADVVWGSDPLMYIGLKEKDKLQQYKSSQADALKEEYKGVGEEYYTLVNARYAVILYNKSNVEAPKKPKSFDSLKEEYWKGRIGIADATKSSTALAITSGLCQIKDNEELDYIKALKANEVLLTKQNGTAVAKVDQGEIDAAIAPHDAALRLKKKAKKEGTKCDLVISWPEEGAISIERPIAIIKNEARPEENEKLSKEFVDFILSKQVQEVTSKFGFISVRNDVELPGGVPKDVKFSTINWKEASENEKKLREEYSKIILGN